MKRVPPFTSLARPPLAWGLGPARGCEQRASRARRLAAPGRRTPSLALRVLGDETTIALPEGSSIARPHGVATARTTHRSGANESRGLRTRKRVQQGEPRLDLSRTPLVTHRMRTASEPDVRRWSRLVSPSPRQCPGTSGEETEPMGRRPSRSTERHRVVARMFDGLGVTPREGREPGDDRDAFCPSG